MINTRIWAERMEEANRDEEEAAWVMALIWDGVWVMAAWAVDTELENTCR
jgi:hypothetical protein